MRRGAMMSPLGVCLVLITGATTVYGAPPAPPGGGHYSGSSGRNRLSVNEGDIEFLAVNGTSTPTPAAPDGGPFVDDEGVSLSPNVVCTARDLTVLVWEPPGGTAMRTFTVWAAGDTAVTCTIGSGDFTCNSGDATAVITPASMISIKASVTGTGDAAEAGVLFGFRCVLNPGQH